MRGIWHNKLRVNGHLPDDLSPEPLLLSGLIDLIIRSVEAPIGCSLGRPSVFVPEIVLQRGSLVHATSGRVDRLLMHFLNIVDVVSERNFIGRGNLAYYRQKTQISDLFDCFGELAVDNSLKSGLIPVVELARRIHELGDECQVAPFDLVFRHRTHYSLAQLAAGQGSVDEGGWLFSCLVKQTLLLFCEICTCEVVFG